MVIGQHFCDTTTQVRGFQTNNRRSHLVRIGGSRLFNRFHPQVEANEMRFHWVIGDTVVVLGELDRELPTRIVEAATEVRPARLSAMALSPGLVERWHLRRAEALAAVREALAQGALAGGDPPPDALAGLVHKLAGSAAMFGEPALGEAAAALDRALAQDARPEHRTALAQALLAAGDATSEAAGQPGSRASARG